MAGNYVLLDRIELNATAASVTFANIPQTGYTDLKVVISIRTDNTDGLCKLYFNADSTASNYSRIRLLGEGGSGASSSSGSDNNYLFMDCSSDTASTFSNGEIYIPNYTSSNQKSISIDTVRENNGSYAVDALMAGKWSGTAAITGMTIIANTGNMVAGSTFSLYGLAAVGTTPAIAPKADGGNVIATDGTYWYHAFLSNGTFTPQVGLNADIFQVAGGGAGGASYSAGGGGAGGVLTFSGQSLTTTGYTCTVGAGGASFVGAYNTNNTNNGNNSQFGSLTASVGGGAGSTPTAYKAGKDGGSGGGTVDEGTVGLGTSGQGNNGGMGASGSGGTGAGAGGGGWGSAGSNSSPNNSGVGGAGNYSALTDAIGTATGAGVLSSGHYYFAGGGGGGCESSGGNPSAGGIGGGGTGTKTTDGGNGVANTGGGGGGAGRGSNGGFPNSGAGGSGIIVIRYPVAS
jgi:hypothetical protein